jgi:hypothetical protein
MKQCKLFVAAAVLASVLSACGSGDKAGDIRTIVVFAAASLKSTFTEIGEQFKTDNPGAAVEFSFAGSSDLVTQLTQGRDHRRRRPEDAERRRLREALIRRRVRTASRGSRATPENGWGGAT